MSAAQFLLYEDGPHEPLLEKEGNANNNGDGRNQLNCPPDNGQDQA